MHPSRHNNSYYMKVRQLASEDQSAWHALWQGYLLFYKTELSDAVTETTWRRLIDGDRTLFALGAFSPTEELLGIAHCIYHASCWTLGDYCYLQDLFVKEEARNTGVATALIEAVYACAQADGASRVYWLTHETNTTAQKLYDKVAHRSGFIQYRKVLSL